MRLLARLVPFFLLLAACGEDPVSASSLILYSESGAGYAVPAHPCSWQSADWTASCSNAAPGAQEGEFCLRAAPLAGTSNWQIELKATAPLNLAAYARGMLQFWIRSTNTAVSIGMQSGFAAEGNRVVALTVLSNGTCGYTNSGEWHRIQLPTGQILGANAALSLDYIAAPFILAASGPGPVFLDDIRLVAGALPPGGGSGGGDGLEIPGWTLVWQDEFTQTDGSYPSSSKWSHDIGYKAPGGPNYWGNSELQYYTATNAVVAGGILHIQARYTGTDPNGYGHYTSARIKTKDLYSFQYGKVQARIKFDRFAQGMWPAFWMLGTGWPAQAWPGCGEIDIMELGEQGRFNAAAGTAHWDDGGHQEAGGTMQGNFYDTWHVIGLDWDAEKLVWHLDGTPFKEVTISAAAQSELNAPFFLILNVAVGGTATGYTGGKPVDYALFPVTMLVDWVRVYTKD